MKSSELPKAARVAWILAASLVLLTILDFVWTALGGELGHFVWVMAILSAVPALPLMAGATGIRRGRVWSAYGLALFHGAGVVALLAAIWTLDLFAASPEAAIAAVFVVPLNLIAVWVFRRAGRALAAAGGERGRPVPWLLVSALVLASPITLVFVRAYVIPTGSMEDTLLIGDHVLVRMFPKPEIRRGQIVAYRSPSDPSETFMKRIVGIPGDRIKLVNRQLWHNGQPVEEAYVVHKTDYSDVYRDNFPAGSSSAPLTQAIEMLEDHVEGAELVVPPGRIFLLGDNRDRSLDSRYHGLVDIDAIVGVPFLIYTSIESSLPSDPSDHGTKRERTERFFKRL